MSSFEPSWHNIKQWICNHLNMKACGGYIMVSHSYVFCFIIWIICTYLKWRHSKSKLCDQILGSMPSDRPKPSPVEFHFNEEANYLDRLGGKKLIGLQLAKWVVTVAVGPQYDNWTQLSDTPLVSFLLDPSPIIVANNALATLVTVSDSLRNV